ncbi:MAG: DNA methyltransferase [Candidatus Margulisiibacteriota bacterium]|jgi:hypothetical protein
MNIAQIEKNMQKLVNSIHKDNFIYEFLEAYGIPKASIARLKKGGLNLSKVEGEILWKKKVFFKQLIGDHLHETIESIREKEKATKHNPRFIIVTDFITLLAIDTKTNDTLDIPILEIARHFDFFLPWAGMEKARHQNENPADVKAAERMAKLYDEIKRENPTKTLGEAHSLNVFLSRLLFCFFADDTDLFKKNQFINAISSHTQVDGSDLQAYLDKLFEVLNTEPGKRKKLPAYLEGFPFVNGGLFRNKYGLPVFTRRSRQEIINCGLLDWSVINPDIFGSMMQAVVTPEHRGGVGMHYTSVPNIMKVLRPLFLDELNEVLDVSMGNRKKLEALLIRVQNIKVFDPACGSGNFLIIAYKELRRLEMKIFRALSSLAFSDIRLSNFYGIELDDFAHEVAILSLWLAEHQMNQEFFKSFGRGKPALPLKEMGNIVHGNAAKIDWEEVCPKSTGKEIYVLGNPPYQGSRKQNKSQKDDLALVFSGFSKYKDLDYIAIWFYKGAKYIRESDAKLAFVSTNSICQGEQVSLIWPTIFGLGLQICFAYTSFKWKNNARDNAGVTVIIVGLSTAIAQDKFIFSDSIKHKVHNINAYLISGESNTFVYSRTTPLSDMPTMNFGNMPADGGKLLFTTEEMNDFVLKEPISKKWFKKLINAQEYLNGRERWCLWLEGIANKELRMMPKVSSVVNCVKEIRKKSSRPQLAKTPHLFAQITQPQNKSCIIVPRVSSESRKYIPIDYLDGENKVTDSFFTIVTDRLEVFSIVTSYMHMVWLAYIGGKLETRYQYSKNVVYNTFPIPLISVNQKKELEKNVYRILKEREMHSEKTLSQLYDPDKMPEGLREAHHQNDLAVESCYRSQPFESDEERLECLFKLYEQMIADEKTKGTLFEAESKTKRKRK